jgi:hypothetical protein
LLLYLAYRYTYGAEGPFTPLLLPTPRPVTNSSPSTTLKLWDVMNVDKRALFSQNTSLSSFCVSDIFVLHLFPHLIFNYPLIGPQNDRASLVNPHTVVPGPSADSHDYKLGPAIILRRFLQPRYIALLASL